MRRTPVDALARRAATEFVLRLPHILWHTISHSLFLYFFEKLIAFSTASEKCLRRIKMAFIYNLSELLTKMVTLYENQGWNVFTTEQACITGQNHSALSPGFSDQAKWRELGEICGIIPKDSQPFCQPADHTVS
jgi:hypothetical protein